MKKLLVISALLSSTSLFSLTLDDAVNEAIQHNPTLHSYMHKLEQAQEKVSYEQSAFLPTLDLGYEYNERDKTIGTQIKKDSSANATVSLNLFNGLQDYFSVQSANFLESSSSYTLKAIQEDIILNTKKAYINYLSAKKNLLTHKEAYKLFDKQYEDANTKYQQGLLSKNDLLQVHVNMLNAKQNVTKAQKEVQVSLLELSHTMGGKNLNNEPINEIQLHDFQIENYSNKSLENRSELLALKKQIQSYKALANSQKGSFLPSIDASFKSVTYGDDAQPHSRSGYEDQNITTITASWNFYNGGSDFAQMKIYLAQKKEMHALLQKLTLEIQLQYEQALLELDVANQNMQTSQLGLEQAKENYEIVKQRFNEGLSSTTDLIDANYLLTQATQRYHESYYTKFLAIATLQRVVEVN